MNADIPTMSREELEQHIHNLAEDGYYPPEHPIFDRILAAFDAQSSALTASEERVRTLEVALRECPCECQRDSMVDDFGHEREITIECHRCAALSVTPQPQTKQEANQL